MKVREELINVSSDASTSRGMAIAAILAAIPSMIWASLVSLLFGFVALTVWYGRNGLENFTQGVLWWLARLLIAAGIALLITGLYRCYKIYHQTSLDYEQRRTARATTQKAFLQVAAQQLKNDQLSVKIEMERQLPAIVQYALTQGHNISYGKDGLRVENYLSNLHALSGGQQAMIAGPEQTPGTLPTLVRYKDIREQVPQDHVLVGVGADGVITRESRIGACLWIVGLSGTGKTSTTVLRVEERNQEGHGFLGIDPHWFKDDSLTNAVQEYSSQFLMPIAKDAKEGLKVLKSFLAEFQARKGGQRAKPWQKITLLIDEVGALMDATTPEEKELAELLPSIARICGQEARNFYMGGIFISQQATKLAWLRKVALMIIVHQLLMQSEKKLAVNDDMAVVKDMETWPIGRTYVYGVGFQDGPLTVQQPFFDNKKDVDRSKFVALQPLEIVESTTDALPIDENLREAIEAYNAGATGVRALERAMGISYYQAGQLYRRMKDNGMID